MIDSIANESSISFNNVAYHLIDQFMWPWIVSPHLLCIRYTEETSIVSAWKVKV